MAVATGKFVYGRLENEAAILHDLRKYAGKQAIKDRLEDTIKRGAEMVRDEAIARAPVGTRPPRPNVKTGRLQRSIKIETSTDTKKEYEKHGYISVWADYPENAGVRKTKTKKQRAGSKEYYAFAVEYGTTKMTARPHAKYGFLRFAVRKKKRAVTQLIRDEVRKFAQEVENKINGIQS